MDNENKWLFGGRMTSNNPEESMKNNEWMLNNCYAEAGKAMYRDHDGEYDIRHLITEIGKTLSIHINATSPDALDFMLFDWLEDGIESRHGVLAMLYNLLWSKAELYEHLRKYEDAEERGEIGRVPRWIPVTPETMPKPEQPVLVAYMFGNRRMVTKAIYEDGTILSDDSFMTWPEIWECGNYDEESDLYFVPRGWWEYGDFAEYNNAIDHPITHWMPLPEPPEES